MNRSLIVVLVFFTVAFSAAAGDNPKVILETSKGNIVLELHVDKAPETVKNFLAYIDAEYYNNTIFHRVIPEFVVQGGGYTPELDERPVREPVINESGNGLKNQMMTVAMARYDDPHSATNQFYFNLADNDSLDPNSRSWGYAVFGEVIGGWSWAASIACRNCSLACSLATAAAPTSLPATTSVYQCALQTLRLSPKARPLARMASARSGASSVRISAQPQPIDV